MKYYNITAVSYTHLDVYKRQVLGCAPCAVNFYTMQLRGEPFLPWDLMQVSEAAGCLLYTSSGSSAGSPPAGWCSCTAPSP